MCICICVCICKCTQIPKLTYLRNLSTHWSKLGGNNPFFTLNSLAKVILLYINRRFNKFYTSVYIKLSDKSKELTIRILKKLFSGSLCKFVTGQLEQGIGKS